MINSLSDLYKNISQQLPGISSPVLETEFRRAERILCRETGAWQQDLTFTGVEDTYTYSITLPTNADLVTCMELRDWNDTLVEVNYYEIAFAEVGEVDGFVLEDASEEAEDDLEGSYTDSGDTYNGATVYTNGTFRAFKAVEGATENADLYLVCLEAAYDALVLDSSDFPADYYAIEPPVSAYVGTLAGYGAYEGTVKGILLGNQAKITVTLDETQIDGRADLDDFTLTAALMPRSRTSAAPTSVLTRYSEALEAIALENLLSYPRSFPWADPVRAQRTENIRRRLVSQVKYENYRTLKRSTVVAWSPFKFI